MNAGIPKPDVSVILPTYNSADGLPRSIKSVLNQTYTNFELIIVNDGSTDNTREVLAAFTDPRIIIVTHPENVGVACAENTGLSKARGKFIGFIGSGDEWTPEKLEEDLTCFATLPPEYGVVYSDLWEIDPEGNRRYWYTPETVGAGLFTKDDTDYQINFIGSGAILVRREIVDLAGGFDDQFRCLSDTDLLIRLQRLCRFHHMKKPNYIYRSNKGISSNPVERSIAQVLLLKKYPETLRNPVFLMNQFDRICSDLQKMRGNTRCTEESISENLFRVFDHRVIRHLCPAGSRRNHFYSRGLAAARRALNPFLRSRRT